MFALSRCTCQPSKAALRRVQRAFHSTRAEYIHSFVASCIREAAWECKKVNGMMDTTGMAQEQRGQQRTSRIMMNKCMYGDTWKLCIWHSSLEPWVPPIQENLFNNQVWTPAHSEKLEIGFLCISFKFGVFEVFLFAGDWVGGWGMIVWVRPETVLWKKRKNCKDVAGYLVLDVLEKIWATNSEYVLGDY